jgi:hypothetical protein
MIHGSYLNRSFLPILAAVCLGLGSRVHTEARKQRGQKKQIRVRRRVLRWRRKRFWQRGGGERRAATQSSGGEAPATSCPYGGRADNGPISCGSADGRYQLRVRLVRFLSVFIFEKDKSQTKWYCFLSGIFIKAVFSVV